MVFSSKNPPKDGCSTVKLYICMDETFKVIPCQIWGLSPFEGILGKCGKSSLVQKKSMHENGNCPIDGLHNVSLCTYLYRIPGELSNELVKIQNIFDKVVNAHLFYYSFIFIFYVWVLAI